MTTRITVELAAAQSFCAFVNTQHCDIKLTQIDMLPQWIQNLCQRVNEVSYFFVISNILKAITYRYSFVLNFTPKIHHQQGESHHESCLLYHLVKKLWH